VSGARRTALGEGLARFSAWLDAFAPRHRALRTPVYLEPDAPAAMRALWEVVGFSDAMLPGISGDETRPERCFADPATEKVIRSWFADPRVRERWGVTSAAKGMEAVRAKLPARTRWLRAVSRWAFFTDETSGADDPPVLELDSSGVVRPSWPSYVEMVLWQACTNVAELRAAVVAGPVPASARELDPPFAPALARCWPLGEGVWALGACPAFQDGAPPKLEAEWSALYQSPAHYFRHVMALPQEELRRHFVNAYGMHYLAVNDGKLLDPERPSVPGFRSYTRASGAHGDRTLHRGLAEVDGLRLWMEKRSGTRATFVYAEPEQFAAVKALLARERLEVYEQLRPRRYRFTVAPRAAQLAAVRKLHDRARAAAGLRGP